MRIGVCTSWSHDDPFAQVREFGLDCCQLLNWDVAQWTTRDPLVTKRQAEDANVAISCLWVGYPGPAVWNFVEGPSTIGLVPGKWRAERLAALKKGADFAVKLGVPAIATHVGFIPENMNDPHYPGVVQALREIAGYCHELGLGFWFETGQETPTTLLRAMEDIDLPNLGVNLDPANLVLYGRGNPIDSLDVFGQYVKCVHAKDGLYPTDGRNLGQEVVVGTGKVQFPAFIKRLQEIGYDGDLIIEREISGPQQIADIRQTVDYLAGLL